MGAQASGFKNHDEKKSESSLPEAETSLRSAHIRVELQYKQ